jgi:hypothetical protein
MSIDLSGGDRKERQTELQLEQNYCTWLWPSSCYRAFGSLTRGNSTIALCARDACKEVPLSIAKYSHWHHSDEALILHAIEMFSCSSYLCQEFVGKLLINQRAYFHKL